MKILMLKTGRDNRRLRLLDTNFSTRRFSLPEAGPMARSKQFTFLNRQESGRLGRGLPPPPGGSGP